MTCAFSTKDIRGKMMFFKNKDSKCIFDKNDPNIGLDAKLIFAYMDEYERIELFIDFSLYLLACKNLGINPEKAVIKDSERKQINKELKRFCFEETDSQVRMFSDTERILLLKHIPSCEACREVISLCDQIIFLAEESFSMGKLPA